ncbi:MAG: lipoyl(octanoyl) transferase LipB [Bacteroidetes bacterium]|nr:lipoyl(octanoyl) transferase LipB [Bacteroidota bacterium]
MQLVKYRDLGTMEYDFAWKLQQSIFDDIVAKKLKNRTLMPDAQLNYQHHLLFVEHDPVITMGKNADEKNLLLNEDFLKQKGVQLFHINRGGDITYHGPGQLVGYPILDLDNFFTDLGKYLRSIEEVIIKTLAEYNLVGERLKGATGVWLDADKPTARKICAIGIRSSRWVTMHGFAFNVNTDLSYFDFIIPCGITDKAVTSLKKELGREIDMQEVKNKLKRNFEIVFNCKLI